MKHSRTTAKMFSVLVLGAATMAEANEPKPSADQDAQRPTSQPSNADAQTANPISPPATRPQTKRDEHCQLEFTLNRYSREGVEHIKTCLDGKTEAEILKVIDDAKKQTCGSPFCGCWLG